MALLFMLTFSSCIQEEFSDCWEEGDGLVTDSDTYITINLKNVSGLGSRAGEAPQWGSFSDGFEEQALASDGHYVFFFNSDKKFVNKFELEKDLLEYQKENDDNQELIFRYPLQEVSEDIYQKYKLNDAGEELGEENDKEILGYCLVLLNAKGLDAKLPSEKGTDVSEFINKIWTELEDPTKIGINTYTETINGDEVSVPYFVMTNSAYFKDGNLQIPTPFTRGAIQKISKDSYDWKKAITVYVERMVSKIEITIDSPNTTGNSSTDDLIFLPTEIDNNGMSKPVNTSIRVFTEIDEDGIPNFDKDSYSYKIKITGWGLNALERETYIFKNINNSSYFPDWSDPSNYRSYWSEDPNYDGDYPWQFRSAKNVDTGKIEYYEEKYSSTSNKNILMNYPYDDFENNFNKITYIPENTFDFTKLTNAKYDNRVNVLAGSHIIVTAELLTNLNGEFEANDVYRDRLGNFYKTEKECFTTLVSRLNNALESQYQMKFHSYNWEIEGSGFDSGDENHILIAYSKGNYKLYYDNKLLTSDVIDELYKDKETILSEADIKGGDGERLMWLDKFSVQNDKGEILPIIDRLDFNEDGSDKPIYRSNKEISKNGLKSLIFEWIGSIDHFKDGRMYYYIPIMNNTDNKIYGNVRNHWYKFNITGVNDIGTSVDSNDDPIVPNKEETQNRLNFKVTIIPWHEFYWDVPIL